MKKTPRRLTALFLLACLLAQTILPLNARADADLTTGALGLDIIKRYEGFSSSMYYEGGRWYVGYGSQVSEGAYPDGVTEDEAETLLRQELRVDEDALNAFFARCGVSPTQTQFDALVSFTYNLGVGWLSGSSDLVKIVRGDISAGRRETVRAFGVWSHSGGKVLPGLAERRLEEAALYLDGTSASQSEFAYLAIEREDGVTYATDFAVYERGGSYDAFPLMIRLGYTLRGLRTAGGRILGVGDRVEKSESVSAVWEKNSYGKRSFDDVKSSDWFYDYVMELSEADVINGRSSHSYAPDASVTVGEALKLVLLAAGNDAQPAAGRHWASGYAQLARDNGYLPDWLLDDLDEPISRLDVARLAAKAMGFGQSCQKSPFADTVDGYVIAMNEIGVLTGMVEGGATVYHPEKTLTRAQIAAIVWRLQNAAGLGTTQSLHHPAPIYNSTFTPAILEGVPRSDYRRDSFTGRGASMWYEEPGVTVLRGVDVSRFQGEIDWDRVKAQGVDFAILRVGGRFQESGEIYDDRKFEEYYLGARAAGLQIGVYFYSQAVNAEEAVEEADYVMEKLSGKQIDGPVVFDWESAGVSSARTNGLPAALVSDCAVAYCDRVKAAGYAPMIYMNTYDAYRKYDLRRLTDYDWWYAGEYGESAPRFFYDFRMWQYTSSASLDGIEGDKVDMDLWFIR